MYYFPHINILRTISSERKNRSKSPVPSPPLPSNFPLSFSFGEDGFTQTTYNSSPLGTGRGLPPPKTPIFDFIFSGRMLPINAAPGDGVGGSSPRFEGKVRANLSFLQSLSLVQTNVRDIRRLQGLAYFRLKIAICLRAPDPKIVSVDINSLFLFLLTPKFRPKIEINTMIQQTANENTPGVR